MSSTGTYRGDSVIITDIFPTRANSGNGKSSHFRQFALRQSADYVDADGMTIQKQPADFYCTTWDPDIISALDNMSKDDVVDVVAFIEPVWRVYIANDTVKGGRDVIPDVGSPERVIKGTNTTVYPTAHPYRLDEQAPGVLVYPGYGLNVTALRPATNMSSVNAQVDGETAENAFAQLQEQQGNLNDATAESDAKPASANPNRPAASAKIKQQSAPPNPWADV